MNLCIFLFGNTLSSARLHKPSVCPLLFTQEHTEQDPGDTMIWEEGWEQGGRGMNLI